MAKKLLEIWEARKKILEGMTHSFFHMPHIEEVAEKRLAICGQCKELDKEGTKCLMPGTQPCCKICGCKLKWKVRCLSEKCDLDKWEEILTPEEEDQLRTKFNITDEE